MVRTVVVCAPKIFSVIPEPKAAPNPSLRGRCIRITKVSSTQTITRMVSKIGIKIDSHIRAGNMRQGVAVVKGRAARGVKDESAMGRKGETARAPGLSGARLPNGQNMPPAHLAYVIDVVYWAVALAEQFRPGATLQVAGSARESA